MRGHQFHRAARALTTEDGDTLEVPAIVTVSPVPFALGGAER
jgi:hypothetical protein